MDSPILQSLLKKVKEITIQTETSLIILILDNELDAIITQSHLMEVFKNQDLELIFKIPQPQNTRRSKIDLGFATLSHEHIYVNQIEIENAAALYSDLLLLKSSMNGFISKEEPRQPSIMVGSKENTSNKIYESQGQAPNSCLKIKRLTIISTRGGSEILKIPGSSL